MTVFRGFPPYFNADSEILILGSFPSVKSREVNFFYGNPLNRFWKTVSGAFGEAAPTTLEEKKSLLLSHKIALWDIVTSCEIVGSLDTAIKNPTVADLYTVLNAAPITKIITNGAKSYQLTTRYFPELKNIIIPLPSTSPANTRFDATLWEKTLKQ